MRQKTGKILVLMSNLQVFSTSGSFTVLFMHLVFYKLVKIPARRLFVNQTDLINISRRSPPTASVFVFFNIHFLFFSVTITLSSTTPSTFHCRCRSHVSMVFCFFLLGTSCFHALKLKSKKKNTPSSSLPLFFSC